jgi:hypothetical protein
MEDKDKAELLLKLAQLRLASSQSRREIEWKISFGLWALLAAAAFYLKNRELALYFGPIILAAHAVLLLQTGIRNRRDTWIAVHHMKDAEELILGRALSETFGKPEVVGIKEWFRLVFNYSVFIQLLTTVLLLISSYLLAR